ncbi:MAG: isoprenylcysteine carboxylmethyltransferase family protein [Pseudomonadales bacterium]|nr:isoprenylcysteine carboxylmethyltransferase family protein [Pseudomonadales bacterium]
MTMQLTLLLTYITIIVGLIWARYRYFNVSTNSSRKGAYFYDPIVSVHIVATLYEFTQPNNPKVLVFLISALCYLMGTSLFVLSIRNADNLDFAFSDKVSNLVTTGTYALVRHPLYVSYALVWLGSTVLFNSFLLWITLAYLIAFYIFSAIKEERVIMNSEYSREYEDYCQDVGMFLPRIREWKN